MRGVIFMEQQKNHIVTLDNRKCLKAGGVAEVLGFNEREVRAALVGGGKIIITGDKLAIDGFSRQTGELALSGLVSGIKYSDIQGVSVKRFFK